MSEAFKLPPLGPVSAWKTPVMEQDLPIYSRDLRFQRWGDLNWLNTGSYDTGLDLDGIFSKHECAMATERFAAYELAAKEYKKGYKHTEDTEQKLKGRRFFSQTNTQSHTPTVHIPEDDIVNEIQFNKMVYTDVSPKRHEEAHVFGRPPKYNKPLEASSFQNPMKLESVREVQSVPKGRVICDPTILEILETVEGNCPIVFTSDEILATLMCAPSSVNSWDIEVKIVPEDGERFFICFDKREGVDNNIGKEWVHETAEASELPTDEETADNVNTRENIALESTKANQAFVNMCTTRTAVSLTTKILDRDEDAHTRKTMYTYNVFTVCHGQPDQFKLIVRCETDVAEQDATGEWKMCSCFGLLQYIPPLMEYNNRVQKAPSINWKQSLSAIVSQEYSTNQFKITRWLCMAYLSEAVMKIGFIGRHTGPSVVEGNRLIYKEVLGHSLIGVMSIDPEDMAMNLRIDIWKLWCNLATVVNSIVKVYNNNTALTEGGIFKDGSVAGLRVYLREPEDDDDDQEEDEDDE